MNSLTIQQQLLDAHEGDTVKIEPGMYTVRKLNDLRPAYGITDANGLVINKKDVILDFQGGILDGTLYLAAEGAGVCNCELTINPADTAPPLGGIVALANNPQIRNCLVHGVGTGISWEDSSQGGVVAHCVVFGCGLPGPGRGLGHSIYVQNRGATKLIQDTYIGPGRSTYGLHAFGHSAPVDNIHLQRVQHAGATCLFDSSQGVRGVTLEECDFTNSTLLIGPSYPENGLVGMSGCTFHFGEGHQAELHNLAALQMHNCTFRGGGLLLRYDMGWVHPDFPPRLIACSGNRLQQPTGGFGVYNWGPTPPPPVLDGVTVVPDARRPGWWHS